MGRFSAALAVAVALLALVPGGVLAVTPYDYVAAQPDMTFLKLCLDNVLPKTSNLWTKASSDNTFFLPTDTAFTTTLQQLGFDLTPRQFCSNSRKKLNDTRNAVIRFHMLEGARTRAQLPGNCAGGCQYKSLAGGKNLADFVTVDVDSDVGTYVIGGNDDNYGDFQSTASGTPRYDIAANGRNLLEKYERAPGQTFAQYLSEVGTQATVFGLSVSGLTNLLGGITVNGAAITYSDCLLVSATPSLQRQVCQAIINFTIVPDVQFLPSFNSSIYDIVPSNAALGFSGGGSLNYAQLSGNTNYGFTDTKLAYRLDLAPLLDSDPATVPSTTSTLKFTTFTAGGYCTAGLASTIKGPVPAGVPNFITKIQSMVYIVDSWFLPKATLVSTGAATMGRFSAALAVAVALLALVPGGVLAVTPYDYVAAQPDMTFLKLCLDNVLPKTSNLWTKASSDNTFFLPTDTAFTTTLQQLGFDLTPRQFCSNSRKKLNDTRNAVIRFHMLEGARTRAQLPGNCAGGCQYKSLAGGKNLADFVTVDVDSDVGTYVIGGNDDNYGDFQSTASGTPRYDIAANGRLGQLSAAIRAAIIAGGDRTQLAFSLHLTFFTTVYEFVSRRVADLARLKKAIDATGLDGALSDPALKVTCFFPDDSAPSWTATMSWFNGVSATLLDQTEYILTCKNNLTNNLFPAGAAGDAAKVLCGNSARDYIGKVSNLLLQHCTPSALITTDTWTNATYTTILPFAQLMTFSNASQYWVALTNDTDPSNQGFLMNNTLAIRKRDNFVAASIIQVVASFLEAPASAPPPPSPPPPSPIPPSPPPPAFAAITAAITGLPQLSITSQLIAKLNLTARINSLIDTTCYFPSNIAWALFGADANDRGVFVNVTSAAPPPPTTRRLLQSAEAAPIQFCMAPGVCATLHESGRRFLAAVPNVLDPTQFYDRMMWNVTLEAPATAYNTEALKNTIINSCYRPDNANGYAVKTLASIDDRAWETALGWTDLSGMVVVKSPFTGACSNASAVTVSGQAITGVNLVDLGYCSQCVSKDDVTGAFSNCSFTVYSLLTGGASAFDQGVITNVGYPRGRIPFVYWMPHDVIVGPAAQPRGYVQVVDRIVQSPSIPPPPPSPRPPNPPPAPFPPPPFTGLQSLLDNTPGFKICASVWFKAFNYYAYIQNFDTSGWTLFIPSDDACLAVLGARGVNTAANATSLGIASAIIKNMFVVNGLYPVGSITNTTYLQTDLGLFGNSSANNMLTFGKNDSGPVQIFQTFPITGLLQTATIVTPDIMIQRAAASLGGAGLAGYVHMTNNMFCCPPPPPPPPFYNATNNVFAAIAREPDLALYQNLLEKYERAPGQTFAQYLSEVGTQATVFGLSVSGLTNLLGGITVNGAAITYSDCLLVSATPSLQRQVCQAIINFTIVPDVQFLPSFNSSIYDIVPSNAALGFSGGGSLNYAQLSGNTNYGFTDTKLAYRLDLAPLLDSDPATVPSTTSTLKFTTFTAGGYCTAGLASTIKGPVPAGVPNFITKIQSMVYIVDSWFLPKATLVSTGAVRAGCP
ncbi:Cell wall glycoprotein 3 [Tetrabaena socialis]|uniref:Cell wall glycoprotein 3 n=1 Tax=Tetrabaena socialis TaxID=47790 RepID=A0A2J8A7F0_9CHLO|nr:Cell wall glycoprotein 3 [Tetrabaena socialis]|eukprot:PNH08451.1 Cell wall glycoprotein 3 [Tetrabaena socialis]